MASFNQIVLMGNTTREIECRFTQGGTAVAEIGLAVNRKFRKQDGSSTEEVLFIDVVVWGNLAENCAKYLAKGRPVLVSGYLTQDNWQDKDTGQNRSKIKVTANVVQFLSGKEDGQGGGSQGQQPTGQQPQRQQQAPVQRQSSGGGVSRGGDQSVLDDLDCPF